MPSMNIQISEGPLAQQQGQARQLPDRHIRAKRKIGLPASKPIFGCSSLRSIAANRGGGGGRGLISYFA
jgi:hypothetical protein